MENAGKANKETLVGVITLLLLIIVLVSPIVWLVRYNMGSNGVTEYSISELKDGVYGIYSVTVSSIPANNYEMITLCANDQVYTFKGDVNIHYTNSNFRLIYEDKRTVYADVMDVYVPKGSIEYAGNVIVPRK